MTAETIVSWADACASALAYRWPLAEPQCHRTKSGKPSLEVQVLALLPTDSTPVAVAAIIAALPSTDEDQVGDCLRQLVERERVLHGEAPGTVRRRPRRPRGSGVKPAQVLEAMSDAECNAKGLLEAIGREDTKANRQSLSQALHKLHQSGRVQRVRRGIYKRPTEEAA